MEVSLPKSVIMSSKLEVAEDVVAGWANILERVSSSSRRRIGASTTTTTAASSPPPSVGQGDHDNDDTVTCWGESPIAISRGLWYRGSLTAFCLLTLYYAGVQARNVMLTILTDPGRYC